MRHCFRPLARPLAVLSITLAAPTVASAQAIMTFVPVSCATGEYRTVYSPYTEAGFYIATAAYYGFTTWCADASGYAGPGLFVSVASEYATLSKTDNGTFSINSIEMAHLYSGASDAQLVTFYGTFFDGGTITQTFTIGAQLGGPPTFTPFLFDPAWTNLIGVAFAREPYQFTNILLDGTTGAVPEPASMMLLGTGLVGLYGVARRRRGNKQI